MGVTLLVWSERSNMVYMKTLKWIVGCASKWMRLNEDFQSTHDLAAWALAYELGDSAVRDRGIVEELSALQQTPVANHGIVYRSSLFKNCIGYTMFDVSAQLRPGRLDAACGQASRSLLKACGSRKRRDSASGTN